MCYEEEHQAIKKNWYELYKQIKQLREQGPQTVDDIPGTNPMHSQYFQEVQVSSPSKGSNKNHNDGFRLGSSNSNFLNRHKAAVGAKQTHERGASLVEREIVISEEDLQIELKNQLSNSDQQSQLLQSSTIQRNDRYIHNQSSDIDIMVSDGLERINSFTQNSIALSNNLLNHNTVKTKNHAYNQQLEHLNFSCSYSPSKN